MVNTDPIPNANATMQIQNLIVDTIVDEIDKSPYIFFNQELGINPKKIEIKRIVITAYNRVLNECEACMPESIPTPVQAPAVEAEVPDV